MLAVILRHAGILLAIMAALSGLCSVYALMLHQHNSAAGLGVTGISSGLVALVLINLLPASPIPQHNIHARRAGLALILMFWLVLPIFAAWPFLFSQTAHSFAGSWFEAVSNLTTAGTSAGAAIQPEAIILWRICLQWLGGSFSTAAAIAIFAEFAYSAAGHIHSRTPFPTGMHIFVNTAKLCAGTYLIAAIIVTLDLVRSGITPILALEAGMALATTSSSLTGILPGQHIMPIIPILALLVGATSLKSLINRQIMQDPEILTFIAMVMICGILLCLHAGQLDPDLWLAAMSYLGTSGMILGSAEQSIPQPIPEFLALAGGCALSTAGGLKIVRITSIARETWRELDRLAFANSPNHTSRNRDKSSDGAFVYLIAYVGTACLLMLVLAASGMEMNQAGSSAIGAITNTGPLMIPNHPDNSTNDPILIALGVGSILGRMEILTPLLALFGRRY